MVKKNVRKWKRSGTDECPICEKDLPLVEHHLHGRNVPRWREEWNVAWMCASCHDLVHLQEVVIEGWWRVNGQRVLSWRRKGEELKMGEGIVPPEYGKGSK